MVISRTPFRVSFFGGGTDYPGWFHKHGGAVLACGIDKYCYITLRYLPPFFPHRYRIVYSKTESCASVSEIRHPAVRAVCQQFFSDRGVEIHHDGDLPARSGMGSSSSFAVGLINAAHALTGNMASRMQLAREAIHLEQEVLGETVGCQDQVLASYGGLNFVRFEPSGEILVRPITISRERLRDFSSYLMLFFTGVIRTSSEVAKSYVPDIGKKEAQLASYVPMVEEASQILSSTGSLRPFGELLHRGWMAKRSLSPEVSSPEIDAWYETARKNGAIGGKLLGAGGVDSSFFLPSLPRKPLCGKVWATFWRYLLSWIHLGHRLFFSTAKTTTDRRRAAGPRAHWIFGSAAQSPWLLQSSP